MERATFRIIDANFNRAREAARVMEEFCRFALNSVELSSRAKSLRHELCDCIQRIDTEKLLISRDSQQDVGRQLQVDKQLKRTDLKDCFVAAAKRLTEALRVLAEVVGPYDEALGQIFEKLRFDAYSLEKDIHLFSSVSEKFADVRLYVLINAAENSSRQEILELAQDCTQGGADCIQLRAKGIADRRIYEIACDLVKLCNDAGVISIINDRADIASLADADGVHLGQRDLPITQARRIQLTPMIFGVSTHSLSQLKIAVQENADYAALGPVFSTGTKPDTKVVGIDYITEALDVLKDTPIRGVAIGGITLENVDEVLKAGADSIAVCSALARSDDPKTLCRKLKDKLNSLV